MEDLLSATGADTQAGGDDAQDVVMDVDTAITSFGVVQAGLAALAAKYRGVVWEVTTTAGMEMAKQARADVRDRRYRVQRAVKSAKQWLQERKDKLTAESDVVIARLEAIENPIDAVIKAEEQRKAVEKAERERLAKLKQEELAAAIDKIRAAAIIGFDATAEHVAATLASLKDADAEYFGDLHATAARVTDEVRVTLSAAHIMLVQREEAARLAREHTEWLEREANARLEQARRDEAARAAERAIDDRIRGIQSLPVKMLRKPSDQIEGALTLLKTSPIKPGEHGDRTQEVADAWAEACDVLAEMLATTIEVEQQRAAQALAAKLKREAAEREAAAEAARVEAERMAMLPPAPPQAVQAPPPAPAAAEAAKPTLKLGTICDRLSFTVGSDFMATLGYTPIIDRNARLFHESDFVGICQAISAHVLAVAHQHSGSAK